MKGLAALAFVAVAGVASAFNPISMAVAKSNPSPGSYRYDFMFSLSNLDSSWAPGQGFGWIIFDLGPGAPLGAGQLASFSGNVPSLAGSPYTSYGISSGGFNGNMLHNPFALWTPTAIGDSFSFWGTSPTNMDPQDLRWTFLIGPAGSSEGVSNAPVPEPATMVVLGLGLAAFRRRRAKA